MEKFYNNIFLLCLPFLFISLSCNHKIRQKENTHTELKVFSQKDPVTVSPLNWNTTNAYEVLDLVFQRLLNYDDTQGKSIPILAESAPQVMEFEDSTVYKYQLRKEARWDNGQVISSKDIDFSLKLFNLPYIENHIRKNLYSFIEDILIDTTNSFRFSLICKKGDFSQQYLSGDFFVTPQYIFDPEGILEKYTLPQIKQARFSDEEEKELKAFAEKINGPEFGHQIQNIIGSGPYNLVSWESGRYIRLGKKDNWWGEIFKDSIYFFEANPEIINFQIINDPFSALIALKNGQIDAMQNISSKDFQDLKSSKQVEKFHFFSPGSYRLSFIGLNSREPKLSSKLTRKALAHLINYEKIIEITQQTYAERTLAIVPPWENNLYNNEVELYQFDPAKSVGLLVQDGWYKDGKYWKKNIKGKEETLQLELHFNSGNREAENTALIFKEEAEKIGIPINLYPIEGATLIERLKSHQFEGVIRGMEGGPFSMNYHGILHTDMAIKGGFNFSGFGTKESDSLIYEIANAKTLETKKKAIFRFQEILHDEATFLFLFFSQNKIAVSKKFDNITVSTFRPAYHLPSFRKSSDNND